MRGLFYLKKNMAKVTRYENDEGDWIKCFNTEDGQAVIILRYDYIAHPYMSYKFKNADELAEFIEDLKDLHSYIS